MGDGWREPWWIPAESPGGIGDPELWIDAATLDEYGGKNPAMVAHVLAGNGGGPWIGAHIQFRKLPGSPAVDMTYMVVARRHSRANAGQPYYVARVPEQPEAS